MLSKDLEQTLNDAFRGARSKRHEYLTVEHLLLALLDNNVITSYSIHYTKLYEVPKHRVGQAQVALGVLEIDRVSYNFV